MPDFKSPFTGNDLPRKMTLDETLRALRFAIAAEYEAVQMYEQIAQAASDTLVGLVMASVAREEMVHAGEFTALLQGLSADDGLTAKEGMKEVDSITKDWKEYKA
jgi:rubrerythrin